MSTRQVLERVHAAGITVAVEGAKLVVEGDELPDDILADLRRHKPELLALLSADQDQAIRDEYAEREAIALHDGGQSPEEVRRLALDAAVTRWLVDNPPTPTDPDLCAHCQAPIGEPGSGGVPFLAKNGHCWLHHGCWVPWQAERRRRVMQAMEEAAVEPTI